VALILTAICIVVLCLLTVIWIKHTKDRGEPGLHGITAEALHTLLTSKQEILLFDVRQPLDLLANSEIIPGRDEDSPKGTAGESDAHPEREGLGRLLHLSQ
jgi:hypothetical protein